MEATQNQPKVKAFFTIADFSLDQVLSNFYIARGVPVTIKTHGHGAANAEIYEILGFGEPKKSIHLSIVTENMSHFLLQELQKKMDLNKPGTGIAFTVPINSINNMVSQLCLSSDKKMNFESEDFNMQQSEPYDLILTIINSGNFSQLMDVAKAAGANGGTLLHARGLASEEAAKFLGITIHPEKDIVLILAQHEYKHKIMESIIQKFGLSTAGKGICFSLPVDTALGLGTKLPSLGIRP